MTVVYGSPDHKRTRTVYATHVEFYGKFLMIWLEGNSPQQDRFGTNAVRIGIGQLVRIVEGHVGTRGWTTP